MSIYLSSLILHNSLLSILLYSLKDLAISFLHMHFLFIVKTWWIGQGTEHCKETGSCSYSLSFDYAVEVHTVSNLHKNMWLWNPLQNPFPVFTGLASPKTGQKVATNNDYQCLSANRAHSCNTQYCKPNSHTTSTCTPTDGSARCKVYVLYGALTR